MTATDRTRDAILDAFLELAHRENAVNISVPAVAQEADVSVRTVYRYFATKDDLQTAAAYRMSDQLLRTVSTDEVRIDNIHTYLDELWGGFARSMPAVIVEHTTPAGRRLRRTRLPNARRAARDGLAGIQHESGGSTDDPDAELVDMAVAVTSSSMFLELVDRMGHTPEHAAALATRLVHILGEHAARARRTLRTEIEPKETIMTATPSPTTDQKEASWEPPGPGSWTRDASHTSPAPTLWFRRIASQNTAVAYRTIMAEWGGALDTIDIQFVHGDMYRRLVPLVGASRDTGKLPPKPVLWLATRLHPGFRARNRTAEQTLENKPYLDVIRGWEDERHEWAEQNRALSAVDPTELDDAELAAHLKRLDEHAVGGWVRHHELHGSDLGPIGDLLLHAKQWGLDLVQVMALLKGASPATVDAARHGDLIAGALRDAGIEPVTVKSIGVIRQVAAAAERLDAFLDEFGWRVVTGYDIEDLTLRELPGAVCTLVAGADAPGGPDGVADGAASDDEAEAAASALRAQADDGPLFDELLASARAAYGMRDDNGPLTWEWPAGLMRRAYLAAGKRLAGDGRIADAAHVFEMDQPELSAVLDGGSVPDDLAERAAHRQWEAAQSGPAFLGPQPDGEPDLSAFPPALARVMGIVAIAAAMLEPDPATTRVELAGLGIGDTTYVGTARVASDPLTVMEEMEPGDVLVTVLTAPSYNVVLSIAGAVVVQEGGLSCHAAVMARELGIPAVIGCHQAMSAITSGDRIEVDPVAGQVRILD